MLKVLDDPIDIVFVNDSQSINFKHYYEIDELDDSIVINTSVVIDNIDRGWRGDISFFFKGYNLEGKFERHDAFDSKIIKDVLCRSRTFEKRDGHAIIWTYVFLKN